MLIGMIVLSAQLAAAPTLTPTPGPCYYYALPQGGPSNVCIRDMARIKIEKGRLILNPQEPSGQQGLPQAF